MICLPLAPNDFDVQRSVFHEAGHAIYMASTTRNFKNIVFSVEPEHVCSHRPDGWCGVDFMQVSTAHFALSGAVGEIVGSNPDATWSEVLAALIVHQHTPFEDSMVTAMLDAWSASPVHDIIEAVARPLYETIKKQRHVFDRIVEDLTEFKMMTSQQLIELVNSMELRKWDEL